MKSFAILLPALSAISCVFASVPTYAEPQLSGMTNQQQAALRQLGFKVAVPGYVPKGFHVAKVTIEPLISGRSRIGLPAYRITYRSAGGSCFEVNGVNGGVGDMWGEFKIPVTSKLLGPTTLYFSTRPGNLTGDRTPSSAMLRTPPHSLTTDWFPYPSSRSQFSPTVRLYRVSSASRPNNMPSCVTAISPQVAMQIVESLEWLP
jgi:hypothetical protein